MTAQDTASLDTHQSTVDKALADLREARVTERIWEHDHTFWGPEPEEISNRLGWLYSPGKTMDALPEIEALVKSARDDGYTDVLLLGMGGSSLAPEVFGKVFGVREGYLNLTVLDSTDPDAVLEYAESLDLTRTMFIVSTKSGGTVETFSFFKYFYNRVAAEVGKERASEHFVAITDPGSGLEDTAKKYGFRATFLNDPDIGGRYSALSLFGMVPAALIGVDLQALLERASEMADECKRDDAADGRINAGVWLGAVMGSLAGAGRDKLTLMPSPSLAAFGPWVEQLIAESTGKDGKGILPVDDEPAGPPELYGDDRIFVSMSLGGDEADGAVDDLARAGHPVVRIQLDGTYDLGAEMFRWEVATAVAGQRLGINPFDQPNVESAKVQARKMVAEYREEGTLPEPEPTVEEAGITAYSASAADSIEGVLEDFLSQTHPGDYVALQAYVRPSEATTDALQEFRARLRDRLRLATTAGYGPRFLHSTGQLHKGDAGNGLFIQFTSDGANDAPIPDEAGEENSSLTFGVLEEAQALGDRQALLDAGRRVIRFHLGQDVAGGLERLTGFLS